MGVIGTEVVPEVTDEHQSAVGQVGELSSGVSWATFEVALEQVHISPVGTPERIEHVAEHRDSADQAIDCDIAYDAAMSRLGAPSWLASCTM